MSTENETFISEGDALSVGAAFFPNYTLPRYRGAPSDEIKLAVGMAVLGQNPNLELTHGRFDLRYLGWTKEGKNGDGQDKEMALIKIDDEKTVVLHVGSEGAQTVFMLGDSEATQRERTKPSSRFFSRFRKDR
jgi:hypothetical protein